MQTYRPKQVPEVIVAKIGEFWSQLKRFPNETVDNYYNHFQELLDDLLEANEPNQECNSTVHLYSRSRI